MRIICSGMPKTGTKTLASALRTLGYNVYDLEEQFYFLGKDLIEITNSGWTANDIKRIFTDVDAVTDVMSNCLWEEIFRVFPDAKVIHTERATEEEWNQSFSEQINKARSTYIARFLANLTPTGRRFRRYMSISMRLAAFAPKPNEFWIPDLNKPLATIKYREHNSRVKEVVPTDQLLLFNLKDGWEPLCKFLDKPIPQEPFPHRNKGGSLAREFVDHSYVFAAIKREFFIVMSIFIVVVGILFYYFVVL